MLGYLITIEGPDGSGKTTQAALLQNALTDIGYHTIRTREPGGSKIAESIRAILSQNECSSITSLLLFMAARSDHTLNVIKPHLNHHDHIVICDRFIDSTIAYQGYGEGVEHDIINMLNDIASYHIKPHITFFLINNNKKIPSLPPGRQDFNRFNTAAFQESVTSGFIKIYNKELSKQKPSRLCALIDVENKTPQETHNLIINKTLQFLAIIKSTCN